MKIEYSKYIKNEKKIIWDKERSIRKMGSLEDTKKKRGVIHVCNVIRHMHLYIYEKIDDNVLKKELQEYCLEIIFRANALVVELKRHKQNADVGWWADQKTKENDEFGWPVPEQNTWKKNRDFNEKENKIALVLIDSRDDVRINDLVRTVHNKVDDKYIKKFCRLLIWMLFRVDQKIISYEKNKKK